MGKTRYLVGFNDKIKMSASGVPEGSTLGTFPDFSLVEVGRLEHWLFQKTPWWLLKMLNPKRWRNSR